MTLRNPSHARRVLDRAKRLQLPAEPQCQTCEQPRHELELVQTEEHGSCCEQCVATCPGCDCKWPRVALVALGSELVCDACFAENADEQDGGDDEICACGGHNCSRCVGVVGFSGF